MFETTAVISRKHPISRISLTSLPVSAGLHLLGGLAVVSTQLLELSFPAHPPAQPRPYVLSGLHSVPPPPPPPLVRPAAPRVIPASEAVPSVSEIVAPTEIPDEISTVPISPEVRRFSEMVPVGAADGTAGGVEGGTRDGTFEGVVGGISAPERKPGDPVLIARDARLPLQPRSQVYPEYPEEARLLRMEGSVLVRYIIDKTGRVREVTILRHAPSPLFDKSALKAIRGWRFHPLLENGAPVEVIHELTVIYLLVSTG